MGSEPFFVYRCGRGAVAPSLLQVKAWIGCPKTILRPAETGIWERSSPPHIFKLARRSPAFVSHPASSPPAHHRYTPSPANTRGRSAKLSAAGTSSRGSYARAVTGPAESPIAYTAPRPMIAPSHVPYIEPRPHSCPCHAGLTTAAHQTKPTSASAATRPLTASAAKFPCWTQILRR